MLLDWQSVNEPLQALTFLNCPGGILRLNIAHSPRTLSEPPSRTSSYARTDCAQSKIWSQPMTLRSFSGVNNRFEDSLHFHLHQNYETLIQENLIANVSRFLSILEICQQLVKFTGCFICNISPTYISFLLLSFAPIQPFPLSSFLANNLLVSK